MLLIAIVRPSLSRKVYSSGAACSSLDVKLFNGLRPVVDETVEDNAVFPGRGVGSASGEDRMVLADAGIVWDGEGCDGVALAELSRNVEAIL